MVDFIVTVRLPGPGDDSDTTYLVAQLGGDNNLRHTETNHRVRSWYPTAIGKEWQVIGRAADLSSDCAGGSMRFTGRRDTTPESFIRAYRSALKDALTLDEARQLGIHFHGTQRRNKADTRAMGKHIKYWLENLAKVGKTPKEETRCGVTYLVADFNLYDPASLAQWDTCHSGIASESFQVSANDTDSKYLKRRMKHVIKKRNAKPLLQPATVASL